MPLLLASMAIVVGVWAMIGQQTNIVHRYRVDNSGEVFAADFKDFCQLAKSATQEVLLVPQNPPLQLIQWIVTSDQRYPQFNRKNASGNVVFELPWFYGYLQKFTLQYQVSTTSPYQFVCFTTDVPTPQQLASLTALVRAQRDPSIGQVSADASLANPIVTPILAGGNSILVSNLPLNVQLKPGAIVMVGQW